MPMWICDHEDCDKPAVRTLGECILCNRHLCSRHLQSEFHSCPPWEDADAYDPAARDADRRELTKLIETINVQALEARASLLREGIPCSIPLLCYDKAMQSSVMGGMNYHVELHFEDGVTWMARVRRSNTTSPPPALRDYIVQSEVATLKFLETTAVPAPRVYDFAVEDDPGNSVGVGFILMDNLPGKALRWELATEEQRKRVMDQLADTFVELRKYPFDHLGCLDSPGEPHIGAFARESLTDFTKSGMRPLGPFTSSKEYHESSIQLILNLILREEMYTQRPVDAYLIHRYLLDIIPQVLPPAPVEGEEEVFYLKHADDKGDHILVDDDFNITGIIDWEWAHTAAPAQALNSPIGLLPVADFYNGKNEIGDDEAVFAQLLEEKGHAELGQIVRAGRLQHRFAFCCGYDLEDWKGFLGLFRGLRDAVGDVDGGLGWEEWKVVAMGRYEEDDGLRELLTRQ